MSTLRTASLSVVGAVVVLGGIALWQGVDMGGVTLRWGGPTARSALEDLGLPPGARAVSAIEAVAEDGTLAGTAARSFQMPAEPGTARAFYVARCRANGLRAAEASPIQPALLCRSPGAGRTTLHLVERCADVCTVTTEIRRFSG